MKRNFFIIIFFILGLTQKSFAYSSDTKQFIQEIIDEAKKVLVDTNSKEVKTQKLSEMALKTVDIKGVAYYSLGKYRKELSDEQMREYLSLFEEYFLKRFTSRFIDQNSYQLSFGAGTVSDKDEDVVPNPDNVGIGLPFLKDKMKLHKIKLRETTTIFTEYYGPNGE